MERDQALLLDMYLAAADAISFTNGLDEISFLKSRLHQNAVIRSLEIIGEAAGKISSTFCEVNPQIPWRDITGMRHRLIHGYGEVRMDVVWAAVHDRLPPLLAVLRPLIPPDDEERLP